MRHPHPVHLLSAALCKTSETKVGEVASPSPFGTKGDASKRSEIAGVCGGGRGAGWTQSITKVLQ